MTGVARPVDSGWSLGGSNLMSDRARDQTRNGAERDRMPKTYSVIDFDLSERVATIAFNRPEALNAINDAFVVETTDAIERAKAAGARVLITTGRGRAYSVGADLTSLERFGERSPKGGVDLTKSFKEMFTPFSLLFANLDLAHISAINGVVSGAALSIALHADIAVAARSATFRLPFADINLIPDMGGTWLLPRAVGRARALGATLLGDKFTAEQAADWGMIWDVVDDESLMPQVDKLARRIANLPPAAVTETKRAINSAGGRSLSEQLAYEEEAQIRLGRMGDFAEGVAAFLEKRKPDYKGS